MRVCMVTTSYPRWRGDHAGNFVGSLVEHLVAEQNADVTVLAPAEAGVPRCERAGRLEIRRLRYFFPARLQRLAYGYGIPWNLKRSTTARLNTPSFLAAFAWGLRAHARRADVIHAQWGVLGALAVAMRRIHCRPVVITIRATDLTEESKLTRRATVWAIPKAEAVTTNYTPSYELACRLRGSNQNCHHINNGVDSPSEEKLAALRSNRAGRDDPVNIISVGRLIPERRHDLLIRAFSRILQRQPQTTLTILGDGPRREALQSLVADLRLADHVRLVGAVLHHEVSDYLGAAHLYVSATTRETFGNGVVEGAAHGLAVITTRVGFPATLVTEGKTGCVVEPDDEDALVEAMLKMLARPEALRLAGERMRKRVQDLGLTWSSCAARYAEAYREVVRDGFGRGGASQK